MRSVRILAKYHVSTLAVVTVMAAAVPALAQSSDVETVVVTGSRGAPRAATDSSAPVATYSGAELASTGIANLNEALQYVDPAVNFAGSVDAGGAANARGATILGLGQDEVLVLVNGKRRAASSLINFNATIGRGEVPVDLGLIPNSAIDHVEVLRDGASAQYGSDAIAGVINIILRKDNSGGAISAQGRVTDRGDGANGELSGWQGFDLGNGGSLTLAEDIRGLNPINRDTIDTRAGAGNRVTNQQGEDGSSDIQFMANADMPLDADWSAYSNLTLAQRHASNTIQFRLPTVDPAVYPAGFLPRTVLRLYDLQGTVGISGSWAGWNVDLSDCPGYDHADFRADHTANPSLGATSPTSVDAGGSVV